MKNSLVNKVKEGAKKVLNVTKRVAPYVGAGALINYLSTQDADAQSRSKYKDHDKDGIFKGYNASSEDLLQEKVFYNKETKKYERFFIQHLDKNLHKNDLDIGALPFYGTMPIMDFKTGDVSHLVSDSMYVFFPIKERSLELGDSHVPDRCEFQIKDIAGVEKGTNYISNSYVKDYFKKLSKDLVLELEDGKSFLILPLTKKEQEEGKTNQLYIPFDDKHQWGVDPITKKLWVFGDIYQGSLETGPVVVSGSTGLVSKLGEKDSFSEVVEEAGEKEAKERKKGDLYLIFGANANDKFWEGNLGIQIGPVAFVANYGLGKDERVKGIRTAASPNTGRYGYGTEYNKGLKMLGASAELHAFSRKKISPFIGGGINKWDYTTEISEQIRDANNNVIKQNPNSAVNSELSYKAKTGINFKAGEKSKLGAFGSYDTKAKFSGGVKFSRKF